MESEILLSLLLLFVTLLLVSSCLCESLEVLLFFSFELNLEFGINLVGGFLESFEVLVSVLELVFFGPNHLFVDFLQFLGDRLVIL